MDGVKSSPKPAADGSAPGREPQALLPALLVLTATAALGVAASWPMWADPTTIAPRTPFTAGKIFAVALARAQVEQHGRLRTWTELQAWPETATFRPIEWPMEAMGVLVDPPVTVNLWFAGLPLLNALGGLLLGRALGLDRWGVAALAGLCAWTPWVRETLANGQLEQAATGAVALLWATALWARAGGLLRCVPLLAVAALVSVSYPHLALGAAIGLGLWAVADSARARRVLPWIGPLLAVGVALGLAAAWHAPNYDEGLQVFTPKGSSGRPATLTGLPNVATLASLVWPDRALTTSSETLHPRYVGLVVLAAALVGARRQPAAAVAAAGLLVLALGDQLAAGVPGPHALLSALSSSIRESASPYRMVGAAGVALAAAAASLPRGPWALVLVAAAWADTAWAGSRPLPYAQQHFPRDPVHLPFREHQGAILDLPLVGPRCPAGTYHYALEATRRHRPTPVLVSSPMIYPRVPGLPRRVADATAAEHCGAAFRALVQQVGFTGVVLHTHDPACPAPRALGRCLEAAFGPGEAVPGLRWWDPLPGGGR